MRGFARRLHVGVFRSNACGGSRVLRAEVSPVDEAIKMAVVRGALGLLTRHAGALPPDHDAERLGGWLPVVTRQTEAK